VVTKSGAYRICNYELSNHFEDDLLFIEKYNSAKVYTAIYFDGEQKFYYLKRFQFESTDKLTNFTAEENGSSLVIISGEQRPRFKIKFGKAHKTRPVELIVADEFIAVKGCKAKGKRLTTYEVAQINEIEPLEPIVIESPPEPETPPMEDPINLDLDIKGEQMSLEL